MSKILFFLFIALFSQNSYDYLDPSSGNALIYLIVSLFGAVVFYLKSFFYKLLGLFLGRPIKKKAKDKLVIFSEGKNYYLTFKPIIEELILRNISFSYITMDIHDPALTIDSEYMNSRYIGQGNRAYAKIASWRAKIMLSTTPNIGCKDFPVRRPKRVEKLVHVWHSVCDTSFYLLGALDNYDVALTVGPWCETSIREVEKARLIKRKEVVACGVPYLDELRKNLDKNINKIESNNLNSELDNEKIILIAPSWGEKNCLKVYGVDFIDDILAEGFSVIIRPHPQSLKVEQDFINNLIIKFGNKKNVIFDFDIDGTSSMNKSSFLISDKSSIRFDYAFLYEKPVLTLDIPNINMNIYEASLIKEHFDEKFANILGIRLDITQKANILQSVRTLMNFKSEQIAKSRDELISNYRNSSKVIVDYLSKSIDEK